ncbi:MAG: hypothetical protein HXX08_20050 [Chloroflexi bacterium]|uniref:AtuA-like ferredoxin-fold domain-containing protein n=1 Tax=Candidatus Chlorohelix allophototropha TaxID=3003348 RepID=A0A8T7M7P0_9CHLR|nr:hypothetical protein [Chloroflexota bacterium]WJW68092.1 hypothetical protein OZ401_003693 [Chloroflexota bacterium L227-S17]
MKLVEIATARSGDKGDNCNVALFVRTPELYELIKREVTAERVKAHFTGIVKGEVERYEVPNVLALNFVLRNALGGGGTRSLALDSLGKTMGAALLRMEIPDA